MVLSNLKRQQCIIDMKRLWLYLVSVMLLAACSDEIPENPDVKITGRTVMSYIVSNNKAGVNLDRYLKNNVRDMYKGIANRGKASTLLVYYRPCDGDPLIEYPSILKFVSDGRGKVNGKPALRGENLTVAKVIAQAEVHQYKEAGHVATDRKVMARVLKDMVALAPADSYGLAMGSHATGWMPGKSVPARAFGDDNKYSIDIPELAKVLEEAFSGRNLDYVLFDACMMANAEVAYELRNVANYCIGSALETPVDGFPYADIMDELLSDDVDYQEICDLTIAYNEKSPSTDWGTYAAIDCSKMSLLADWVKMALKTNQSKLNSGFERKVMQYGTGDFTNYSFDIVDFFNVLEGSKSPELKALMDDVVVGKSCLAGNEHSLGNIVIDEDRFCGIGMYFPYRNNNVRWDRYFETSIAWAKAVEWSNYRL